MFDRLRSELRVACSDSEPSVPTHGDWQPRNWLTREGRILVIDFGRADWRPANTDLVRLEVQQFVDRPDLEAAFYDAYGSDPRQSESWRRALLREAVGTAVYAYRTGNSTFEEQGHRMIAGLYGTR